MKGNRLRIDRRDCVGLARYRSDRNATLRTDGLCVDSISEDPLLAASLHALGLNLNQGNPSVAGR